MSTLALVRLSVMELKQLYGKLAIVMRLSCELSQLKNLTIKQFPIEFPEQLEKFHDRNMESQCSMQDTEMWLTCGDEAILAQTPTINN